MASDFKVTSAELNITKETTIDTTGFKQFSLLASFWSKCEI